MNKYTPYYGLPDNIAQEDFTNSAGYKYRLQKYVCIKPISYKNASVWDNITSNFEFEYSYFYTFHLDLNEEGFPCFGAIINNNYVAYTFGYWEHPDSPGHCSGIKFDVFMKNFISLQEWREIQIDSILYG